MKKILIVDDMMVSLLMTENMLSSQYKTVCALSGKEAIEKFRLEKPDLVLSDLRMPEMNGYELQQVLQEEYNKVIPFMFMTADHDEETESKGFENGAMDFIRKPFRPDVLLRRISNILQNIEQRKNASIDALTGLLNKASSEEELTQVCQHSQGVLMMIDLDSFKLVNDIYGHSVGDKILVSFAEIIRAAFRLNDILGRIGGDEFIAFCHGIKDEGYISSKTKFINEKLMTEAKNLMGDDMNIPIGASIGCVFVPDYGNTFSDLYKKADKALYLVKQRGKHGFNIFSDNNSKFEAEKTDLSSLSNIEKILSERNQKNEAFIVPMENFRAIYIFLHRVSLENSNSNVILLITLIPQNITDASEIFFNMLKTILRSTDVITQSNPNQFIVILYNIVQNAVNNVIDRINNNWTQNELSKTVKLNIEWDSI